MPGSTASMAWCGARSRARRSRSAPPPLGAPRTARRSCVSYSPSSSSRTPISPAKTPAAARMSGQGIATPHRRSTPRRPSIAQPSIEQPPSRAPEMSAPVRSQRLNATDSIRAARKSASRRLQSSNKTLDIPVRSNEARSARQSEKVVSPISPDVHAIPVSRAPETDERRIEPPCTEAFERSQRTSEQPLRKRFGSFDPLKTVAEKSTSMKPSARASTSASTVSTSSTSSQLSPSAASSGESVIRSSCTAAVSLQHQSSTPLGEDAALPGTTPGPRNRPRDPQHKPTREYSVAEVGIKELLEAGVHFGHQTRRWNPKMRRFIFGERAGIHIIDLQQTDRLLKQAQEFCANIASRGGTVMFVGTKKQARDAVKEAAEKAGMPYIDQRWLGGLLTN